VGIAFAHKYRKEPNICMTMYGDGAANQVGSNFHLAQC
jgi:pyruvate dehydrogenase E1 component alpha subunit